MPDNKTRVGGARLEKKLARRLREYVGRKRLEQSGEDVKPTDMLKYEDVIREALDQFLTEHEA